MHIIRESTHERREEYSLSYLWNDDTGGGFGFPCDKNGNILYDQIKPEAQENLKNCLNGTIDVRFDGVKDYSDWVYIPKLIRCECGEELEMYDPATNACSCGRLYNGFGQELAPMSQWEETDLGYGYDADYDYGYDYDTDY